MFSKHLCTAFRNLLQVSERSRAISTAIPQFRDVTDRREMLRSVPKLDEGSAGEKAIEVDYFIQ